MEWLYWKTDYRDDNKSVHREENERINSWQLSTSSLLNWRRPCRLIALNFLSPSLSHAPQMRQIHAHFQIHKYIHILNSYKMCTTESNRENGRDNRTACTIYCLFMYIYCCAQWLYCSTEALFPNLSVPKETKKYLRASRTLFKPLIWKAKKRKPMGDKKKTRITTFMFINQTAFFHSYNTKQFFSTFRETWFK